MFAMSGLSCMSEEDVNSESLMFFRAASRPLDVSFVELEEVEKEEPWPLLLLLLVLEIEKTRFY